MEIGQEGNRERSLQVTRLIRLVLGTQSTDSAGDVNRTLNVGTVTVFGRLNYKFCAKVQTLFGVNDKH